MPVREREKGLRNRKFALASVTHYICQHHLTAGTLLPADDPNANSGQISTGAAWTASLTLWHSSHTNMGDSSWRRWLPWKPPCLFLDIINALCLSKIFFTNANLAVRSRWWVSPCHDGGLHLQVLSLHSSPGQLHHGGWTEATDLPMGSSRGLNIIIFMNIFRDLVGTSRVNEGDDVCEALRSPSKPPWESQPRGGFPWPPFAFFVD